MIVYASDAGFHSQGNGLYGNPVVILTGEDNLSLDNLENTKP